MRWRKTEKDFVESARVARLATTDAKRVPHNVPICPTTENSILELKQEQKSYEISQPTLTSPLYSTITQKHGSV